jgi:hypothetical protein
MRSLRVPLLFLVGALSVSCGGDSPTSPEAQDIRLVGNEPSSGATIPLGCSAITQFICTDNLALMFDVRFDRKVEEAWLEVEFRDAGGRNCAGTTTRLTRLASDNQATAMTRVTLLSSPRDLTVPLCTLPVTTTHIVATLVDAATDTTLLTREFAARYTFAAP